MGEGGKEAAKLGGKAVHSTCGPTWEPISAAVLIPSCSQVLSGSGNWWNGAGGVGGGHELRKIFLSTQWWKWQLQTLHFCQDLFPPLLFLVPTSLLIKELILALVTKQSGCIDGRQCKVFPLQQIKRIVYVSMEGRVVLHNQLPPGYVGYSLATQVGNTQHSKTICSHHTNTTGPLWLDMFGRQQYAQCLYNAALKWR